MNISEHKKLLYTSICRVMKIGYSFALYKKIACKRGWLGNIVYSIMRKEIISREKLFHINYLHIFSLLLMYSKFNRHYL